MSEATSVSSQSSIREICSRLAAARRVQTVAGSDVLEDEGGAAALNRAAAGVLRFSEDRDPAVLAQFVRLRVIDPEGAY
ncbi:hypothetical protein ACVWZD_005786 [Streptomyces sp. TE3672]